MAAVARWINTDILFTNSKLPSIHFKSEPRSRSKASTYSYTQKIFALPPRQTTHFAINGYYGAGTQEAKDF